MSWMSRWAFPSWKTIKKPWKIMTTLDPSAQTLVNHGCVCPKGAHGSYCGADTSPKIDDHFDEDSSKRGKFADAALSHLMKLLYIARLCCGDLITTVTFLARRVHFGSINEDRRV